MDSVALTMNFPGHVSGRDFSEGKKCDGVQSHRVQHVGTTY